MSKRPTNEQIRDWQGRLYVMLGEMEEAYGEPGSGASPVLESLVRAASFEAARQITEAA